MKTFWMCYVDGGNIPRVKHPDFAAAQIEAERLARKERRPVYILATLAVTKVAEVPTTTVPLDPVYKPDVTKVGE